MTAAVDQPHVGLVVEGPGDLRALPELLRKHLGSKADYRDLLSKPIPCHGRENAIKPGGIEAKATIAAARPGCVGVLIVLDAESEAVCPLGPTLRGRARTAIGKPAEVVLADTKFESWLVASAETLNLPSLAYDPTREPCWLIDRALRSDKGEKYTKPVWQVKLAVQVDLALAATRSPSLARLLDRFDAMTLMVP